MNVTIFGLGYVGVVSAACLARDGHHVTGVDPNPIKVDIVNGGNSPIVEPGLALLIGDAVRNGRLFATQDPDEALRDAEVVLVCVGTPGNGNGSLDLAYVRRVCEEIGERIGAAAAAGGGTDTAYKVVAMRSTMLPGSMQSVVVPTLEAASGLRAGRDFGVCINPEFLREGSAIKDYDSPPKTVVGADDERAASTLARLYEHIDAPLIVTDLKTAEMIKYADNSWHALKVTFANEMGRLCKALDVDSRKLMHLFCEDTKLNISSTYLRPGFAFGGSCLPKDLRALLYKAKLLDVETPVLSQILHSNQQQIDAACERIRATGHRRVGMLGLSFKEGTDDLRESPIVALSEQLIGKGYDLLLYDRNVQFASLVGANREYILNRIPHISRLLVERAEDVIERSDVVVLATGEKEFGDLAAGCGRGKTIVDLVGVWGDAQKQIPGYDGLAW